MIGCLTETTICVVAKPLVLIKTSCIKSKFILRTKDFEDTETQNPPIESIASLK